MKYFVVPEGNEYELRTPLDIIRFFEKEEDMKILDYSSQKRLGQAMVKHGFRKKSVKNSKPYMVQLRTQVKDDNTMPSNPVETTESTLVSEDELVGQIDRFSKMSQEDFEYFMDCEEYNFSSGSYPFMTKKVFAQYKKDLLRDFELTRKSGDAGNIRKNN